MMKKYFLPILGALSLLLSPQSQGQLLTLEKGNRICLIGGTFAERMQHFGHWETLLHQRFPEHQLVVRNLAYSADELELRPRSQDFGSPDHHLTMNKADVVLAFFGFNESFAGEKGLEKFKTDLEKFITHTRGQKYNGQKEALLVLVSPLAFENLENPNFPDGSEQNKNLKLYTDAIKTTAEKHKVPFVDLFTPSKNLFERAKSNLTINGIHPDQNGDREIAMILDGELFGKAGAKKIEEKLLSEVNKKNFQFFHRYRAVNGYYIYGGRSQKDGKVGGMPFEPPNYIVMENERKILDEMTAIRDQRIWAVAQGKSVSPAIDDSSVSKHVAVETNYKQPVKYLTPEESQADFKLAPGYAVNLFASEVEFPELSNPVAMTFDAKGRLWVATMPSYPQYTPGKPLNDKVLIFEDTNADGKADKVTTFADKLHVPTGLELGDGGLYLAQQPDLMFLKDTDGDGKADVRNRILHGFDTADTHHAMHTFTWDQGGALYFQEGTFHRTQVETPYGPQRLADAGVFRYEPRSGKFETFVSYGFANPWGHAWDRWGQNFVSDASGGANYYGTAFSGWTDYPRKHKGMKQWFKMRVRPTSGCEFVSSRHFPESAQGNFLLNNVIGFQGVLQHTTKEDGSGFAGTEIEPLIQSSDRNFRPVDMEFAPDGSFFICDWHNVLVGHMQHSIRDPLRDTTRGRIWRITYPERPLVKPAKIAGESIENLLNLLKVYEDRTRYRVRIELRERPTDQVMAALDKWIGKLDPKDPEYQHHLLEGLWVHQQHNRVNQTLLKQLLRSPDYRARAAATRVLCYWRDRVENPLALLKTQVNDEHPRVRLEAVRACSFFKTQEAADVALESLAHPQDDYLKYCLDETMGTLEKHLK
ncbi:MAG: GDSL-type esterase/lipase family protein [Verrucomicrobiota bacterium]|nr:GDSL-type esterase/lipase family protein [Verrucomicrobiota bacterium]